MVPGLSCSASAPLRVDLSAGFTDIRPSALPGDGLVLNVAVAGRVRVTACPGPVGAGGPADGSSGSPDFLAELPVQVVKLVQESCRRSMPGPVAWEVHSPGPVGVGLGSSGALGVAMVSVATFLAGCRLDLGELAALAVRAERQVGNSGGVQDQLAAAQGGLGLVRVPADGPALRDRLPADLLHLPGHRWMLAWPGGSRQSGRLIDRLDLVDPASPDVAVLRDLNQLARVLLDALTAGDAAQVALAYDRTLGCLRALHPEIVHEPMLSLLRGSGVRAGKPCGAGGRVAAWVCLVEDAPGRLDEHRLRRSGVRLAPLVVEPEGVQVRPAGRPRPPPTPLRGTRTREDRNREDRNREDRNREDRNREDRPGRPLSGPRPPARTRSGPPSAPAR